jgi:hypothetical protein
MTFLIACCLLVAQVEEKAGPPPLVVPAPTARMFPVEKHGPNYCEPREGEGTTNAIIRCINERMPKSPEFAYPYRPLYEKD